MEKHRERQNDKKPERNTNLEQQQKLTSAKLTGNEFYGTWIRSQKKKKVQPTLQILRPLQRKDLSMMIPPPAQGGYPPNPHSHLGPALQLPLTWIVVGRGLVDHGGVFGEGAEGGQNYSEAPDGEGRDQHCSLAQASLRKVASLPAILVAAARKFILKKLKLLIVQPLNANLVNWWFSLFFCAYAIFLKNVYECNNVHTIVTKQ